MGARAGNEQWHSARHGSAPRRRLDGSPPPSRALNAAANLLQGRTGRIEVVYVAHMPSTAALPPAAVGKLETDFNDVEQELRTMAATQVSDRVEH